MSRRAGWVRLLAAVLLLGLCTAFAVAVRAVEIRGAWVEGHRGASPEASAETGEALHLSGPIAGGRLASSRQTTGGTLSQPRQTASGTLTQPRQKTGGTLTQLPLYFIENRGQVDGRVGYYVQGQDKTYEARARLGIATETGDIEGETVRDETVPEISEAGIETAMDRFRGNIQQVPPMYSALKHEGKPLYKLAREGRVVERKPRVVTIHELELLAWESPDLTFSLRCSKGTYVRTLAEDLAAALGSCAHLRALRRTASGPFEGDMISLERLESMVEAGDPESLLLPPDAGLADWPVVTLDETSAIRFSHGNPASAVDARPGDYRVYGSDGILLGLGEIDAHKQLKPKRIFNLKKG